MVCDVNDDSGCLWICVDHKTGASNRQITGKHTIVVLVQRDVKDGRQLSTAHLSPGLTLKNGESCADILNFALDFREEGRVTSIDVGLV